MNKTITVIYPNNEWINTINESLKGLNAKIIKKLDYYNVAYGRQVYSELACVVSVDTSKLDNYLLAHIQKGNQII